MLGCGGQVGKMVVHLFHHLLTIVAMCPKCFSVLTLTVGQCVVSAYTDKLYSIIYIVCVRVCHFLLLHV